MDALDVIALYLSVRVTGGELALSECGSVTGSMRIRRRDFKR
jgi:hypothetical protein